MLPGTQSSRSNNVPANHPIKPGIILTRQDLGRPSFLQEKPLETISRAEYQPKIPFSLMATRIDLLNFANSFTRSAGLGAVQIVTRLENDY
jgi:hypothetical protein